MPAKDHKIEKIIDNISFLDLISGYKKEDIICTEHAFFRLNEEQRKLFKCDELKDYIINGNPIFAGIQSNKIYAVFYKHKSKDIIRIMLDIQPKKIEIVTFYRINKKQIPRI